MAECYNAHITDYTTANKGASMPDRMQNNPPMDKKPTKPQTNEPKRDPKADAPRTRNDKEEKGNPHKEERKPKADRIENSKEPPATVVKEKKPHPKADKLNPP